MFIAKQLVALEDKGVWDTPKVLMHTLQRTLSLSSSKTVSGPCLESGKLLDKLSRNRLKWSSWGTIGHCKTGALLYSQILVIISPEIRHPTVQEGGSKGKQTLFLWIHGSIPIGGRKDNSLWVPAHLTVSKPLSWAHFQPRDGLGHAKYSDWYLNSPALGYRSFIAGTWSSRAQDAPPPRCMSIIYQ